MVSLVSVDTGVVVRISSTAFIIGMVIASGIGKNHYELS
jgi:hypothetical protein